jgi:hypothetical protein
MVSPLSQLVGGRRPRQPSAHRLPRWPVLISLHSAVRERNLHHQLATTPTRVVVATSSRDQLATGQLSLSPADQVSPAHPRHRHHGTPSPR